MNSTAALQRRISMLEASIKPPPCPPLQTHIVHGETRTIRDAKITEMIEQGEATSHDIFLLVIEPGET